MEKIISKSRQVKYVIHRGRIYVSGRHDIKDTFKIMQEYFLRDNKQVLNMSGIGRAAHKMREIADYFA